MQRNTEPKQTDKLSGTTNKQEFPARVSDDSAQEDNRRRIQAAKEADLERQTFEDQREALSEKPVRLTDAAGTVVTASGSLVDTLKASGFKAAK